MVYQKIFIKVFSSIKFVGFPANPNLLIFRNLESNNGPAQQKREKQQRSNREYKE